MPLSLFPVRAAIGQVTMPDGTKRDVFMTQEYARALSDLLERVGGADGSSITEVVSRLDGQDISMALTPAPVDVRGRVSDLEAAMSIPEVPRRQPNIPRYIGARDAALMAAYIRNGGIRIVTLGDSIKAGIGSGGSSPYGECADPINQADTNLLAYALMYADPNFVAPRDDIFPVQPAYTSAGGAGTFAPLGSMPLPNWQITKTKDDTIRFVVRQDESTGQLNVSLYFLSRNSPAAATFRWRVFDGATLLGTATVDTWTANPTFTGVGPVAVQGRVDKATMTLTAAARVLTFVIDTPNTVGRDGNAPVADGTAMIFGATAGDGVFFRNLAVSSSTLLDSSADNISRGITTTERLAKAAALNANTYFIGWGTNDSKLGVSTPNAYKSQLASLITGIRATVVNPVIILATAPRGLGAPYQDNYIYNAAMREIAGLYDVSLIDFEDIAAASPAYSDLVHPTRQGYAQMYAAWCAAFGVKDFRLSLDDLSVDTTTYPKYISQTIAGGVSNFTGVATTIATQTANRPGNSGLRVRLTLNFAATTAFNQSVVRVKLQGYAGLNGTGAAVGSTVVVASSVFSAPLVGTIAVQPFFAEFTRIFSQLETRSIVLTVEGINWGLRNADAIHLLELEFIPLT